jgi:hypothetical protein
VRSSLDLLRRDYPALDSDLDSLGSALSDGGDQGKGDHDGPAVPVSGGRS